MFASVLFTHTRILMRSIPYIKTIEVLLQIHYFGEEEELKLSSSELIEQKRGRKILLVKEVLRMCRGEVGNN